MGRHCRVLGQFISEELDINYTNEKIYMFNSRAHRSCQDSAKSRHKGQRPLFAQFTNWQFAEEVHARIINLTSKRRLSMYASQCIPKLSNRKTK